MYRYVLLAILAASQAHAQQALPYVPLDEATWRQMVTELEELPISARAHIRLKQTLDTAQRLAAQAAQQRKAEEEAKKPIPTAPSKPGP